MAALLKHAQLSKQYQLEIEVSNSDYKFHNKVGYIPIIGKFALYEPGDNQWYNVVDIKDFVQLMKLDETETYSLTITPNAPGNADQFTIDSLDEGTGEEICKYLLKLLKLYGAYASNQYNI